MFQIDHVHHWQALTVTAVLPCCLARVFQTLPAPQKHYGVVMFLPIFKVFSNLKTWGSHLAISTDDRFLPQDSASHTLQGSLRVAAHSQRKRKNHINSLKYFSVFLLNCKIRHATTTWKELIRKALCLPIFRNITEITKKRRVYLGDAVIKLQTFVWIFNHVSRVTTWSLFNLRGPDLVK